MAGRFFVVNRRWKGRNRSLASMTPANGKLTGELGGIKGNMPTDERGWAAEGENRMGETTRQARQPRKKRAVLEALENGATLAQAAAAVKVVPLTVRRWRKADPEFQVAVNEAMELGTELAEDALLQCATRLVLKNPAYQTSLIFLLKNRRPDRWRDVQDRRHQGSFRHEVSLTDEQRRAELDAYISEIEADAEVEAQEEGPEGPTASGDEPSAGLHDPGPRIMCKSFHN